MNGYREINPCPLLAPLPVVLVSCGEGAQTNALAVAWAGVVCSHPPMVSVSIRPDRYSHDLIRERGVPTYHPSTLTNQFHDFLVRYKFPPYRLHDCRHFFASYCHSIGIPEADILAGGGWKTANVMKAVYRHSMARNRASAAINNLF